MKKILFLSILLSLFIVGTAYSERDTATVTTYKTSQLIKTGEGLIYSVTFVATSNGGNYVLYDATSTTAGWTDIKAEGSEATSANSHFQSFKDKPIEFHDGLYLLVTNGYVILEYQ